MRDRSFSITLKGLLLLCLLVSAGQAQPTATATTPAASATAAMLPVAEPPAPVIAKLEEQTKHVKEFLAGTLSTDVTVSSIFDIDVSDEKLIAVEVRRISSILAQAEAARTPAPVPTSTKKKGPAAEESPAPSAQVPLPAPQTDPGVWQARRALDEARLQFYRLPPKQRAALIAKHDEALAALLAAKKTASEAELEASQAAREAAAAMKAAAGARSEAERSVHAEYARLLGVAQAQAKFEKALIQRSTETKQQHDDALKLRRELSDELDRRAAAVVEPTTSMDSVYVGTLRPLLRSTRAALASAIDALTGADFLVPGAGPDPLVELPADIDRSKVDNKRAQIEAHQIELLAKEEARLEEQARLLMADVEMLNRLRLRMLPELSSTKRDELTAFSLAGFDQARSEWRQVWLTLRYHLHATKTWALAIHAGTGRGESALTASLVALRWLVPIALFIWWRRRAASLLALWMNLAEEPATKRQTGAVGTDRVVQAITFLTRVHQPLAWLLLLWTVLYLLPDSIRNLLEIEIINTVLTWTAGGTLIVNAIDALSSDELRGLGRSMQPHESPHLRLRSLRLIGRTVVVFGLILALSSELVGEGTIYSWVFSTCWFAALPIFLTIVAWWKPIIFKRVELVRKKGKLERWVLAQEKGPTSFVAAIAGGVNLFATGALRVLRSWLITFTLVRRLLAYLFRRGMDKKAAEAKIKYAAIGAVQFAQLGPETSSDNTVPSIADAQVEGVIARIKATGGGVYAIVGERGCGRTTTMKRIAAQSDQLNYVTCPIGGIAKFKQELNRSMGLEADAPFEAAAGKLEGTADDSAVLIDDAHHLILPMMGGLREFDSVLALARDTSSKCTWIFALDEALWRFLERARGSKPLFDEAIHLDPWTELGIVRLLHHRNLRAGISPKFDHLLTDLPADADEVDIAEALQRTEAAYYRLLWDYSSGNPGVALHFWRNSLGIDSNGDVRVRLFQAPEAEALEGLPDSAVFVLRATVQLGFATVAQICQATSIPESQVRDALRYGLAKGYFVREDERYVITWDWFRAITRFLKRRHLLFTG